MSTFNPYEAPRSDIRSLGGNLLDGDAIWQDGDMLVARNEAEYPDRCIKCNAPAEGYRFRRTVRWHPPLVYLVLLANILLYALIATIVSKKSRVEAGLCRAHRVRRRNAILTGWGMAIVGVVVFIAGLSLDAGWKGVPVVLGLCLVFGGAIYGILRAQIYVPKKINKEKFVWLRKVDSDFLASLPAWPN